MTRYVFGRLLQGALVLWVVATVTFGQLRLLPGGPFDREKVLPPEILRNVEARYHLDAPLLEQYARYLARLAQGDLGPSYKYVGRDVSDILRDALPVSIQLGGLALALAIGLGVAVGLLAGTHRGRRPIRRRPCSRFSGCPFRASSWAHSSSWHSVWGSAGFRRGCGRDRCTRCSPR